MACATSKRMRWMSIPLLPTFPRTRRQDLHALSAAYCAPRVLGPRTAPWHGLPHSAGFRFRLPLPYLGLPPALRWLVWPYIHLLSQAVVRSCDQAILAKLGGDARKTENSSRFHGAYLTGR